VVALERALQLVLWGSIPSNLLVRCDLVRSRIALHKRALLAQQPRSATQEVALPTQPKRKILTFIVHWPA